MRNFIRLLIVIPALAGSATLSVSHLAAQQPPAGSARAPATPRASARVDLTGYWVSLVTEDWRWRMMTPPKGDYTSVPLNDEGRRVADTWEPAMDGSCQAYGAAGLMRIPTRLHITWDADDVLKVATDAGQQTRALQFDSSQQPGARSLQGFSQAAWEPIGGPPVFRNGVGGGPAAQGGTLRVVTTNLTAGWLRKNGVPYSENATLTEYWDRVAFPNGDVFLTVTTIVADPKYLLNEFTTSTHFKLEPDGSKWTPAPCRQIR